MLNLSDKELDRLSKEAAQEYDPGDVLGEGSWEKLEIRMDRDLGRLPGNPLRHIRRFPFYYAPALLVLIGVSYFLVRQGTKGSGSPPASAKQTETAAVKNIPSSKTAENTDKLNSTPAASPDAPASPASAAGKAGSPVVSSGAKTATGNTTSANPALSSHANNPGSAAPSNAGDNSAGPATHPGNLTNSNSTATHPGNLTNSARTTPYTGNLTNSARTHNRPGNHTNSQTQGQNNNRTRGRSNDGKTRSANDLTTGDDRSANDLTGDDRSADPQTTGQHSSGPAAKPAHELTRSTIGGLSQVRNTPYIDDSALRHFTLKSKKPEIAFKSVHIYRSLQFGLLAAPDFASVNALAGDKAGSTIGATVDYQFANRWYIGSGLLLDRKNYAARSQDFQIPPGSPLTQNVVRHMQYVKGSFDMLEIPLNLRYDFSVTGNTLFFASGGISSYLFTSENNGFYYFDYGRLACDPQKNPNTSSYLFSSLHFSLGVEAGLSNSLSVLIAPYADLPMRGIGLGQVQMSSVGINFSLKFAPVSSRKRY